MPIVKEHTKAIDGLVYTARTLPAMDALILLPRLVSLVGPKALKLLFSAGSGVNELLTDPAFISGLMAMVAENITASITEKGIIRTPTPETVAQVVARKD